MILFRYAFKLILSGGGALIRLSRWQAFAVYTIDFGTAGCLKLK